MDNREKGHQTQAAISGTYPPWLPAANRYDAGVERKSATWRVSRLFVPLVVSLGVILAVSGCGRSAAPPTRSMEPSASVTPSDPQSATSPTDQPSEQTGAITPEPSEAQVGVDGSGVTYPSDPAIRETFALDDFQVPEGSRVSKEEWLTFIRMAIDRALPVFSASQRFHEAYDFSVAPSAGSGEWQVQFSLVLGYHEPGATSPFGPWGPEIQQADLVALEKDGLLTALDLQLNYLEGEVPEPVITALQHQYDYWMEQWKRASSKGVEPIPAITTPIAATPVVQVPQPFAAPLSGEMTADLDGDGRTELVTVRYGSDYRLRITAGEAVLETWYDTPEGVYLVDVDEADGRLELAVTDYGPSSDEITQLLAYENGVLTDVGTVSGILFAGDGKGRISTYARGWQGPLLTWFFNIEYELREGRVEMMPTRWYASSVPVSLRHDMTLYGAPDSDVTGEVWPAGTEAVITLSDVSKWFRLDTADGRQGWIQFHDRDNLLLPDGSVVDQQEALDGIVAAD